MSKKLAHLLTCCLPIRQRKKFLVKKAKRHSVNPTNSPTLNGISPTPRSPSPSDVVRSIHSSSTEDVGCVVVSSSTVRRTPVSSTSAISPTCTVSSIAVTPSVSPTSSVASASGSETKTAPSLVDASSSASCSVSEITTPTLICLSDTDSLTPCKLVRLQVMNERTLSGHIRVANYGFKKHVFVRWTEDNWQTYEDTPATYTISSKDERWDSFEFALVMSSSGNTVEFAVCYQAADGAEFWDNNWGGNFTIKLH